MLIDYFIKMHTKTDNRWRSYKPCRIKTTIIYEQSLLRQNIHLVRLFYHFSQKLISSGFCTLLFLLEAYFFKKTVSSYIGNNKNFVYRLKILLSQLTDSIHRFFNNICCGKFYNHKAFLILITSAFPLYSKNLILHSEKIRDWQ